MLMSIVYQGDFIGVRYPGVGIFFRGSGTATFTLLSFPKLTLVPNHVQVVLDLKDPSATHYFTWDLEQTPKELAWRQSLGRRFGLCPAGPQ